MILTGSKLLVFCFLVGTEMFEPVNLLRFADHLFEQGDYSAALGEYRRYLFISDSLHDPVSGKIVDCLVRLERFDEALVEAEKLSDLSTRRFTKGQVFYNQGQFDSSRIYLDGAVGRYSVRAKVLIGLGYLRQHDFTSAGGYLELPQPLPRLKNPILGAGCALIPGGGHFYAGRISDGLYSLVIVSTASVLSYYYHERGEDIKFGVALSAAIMFYAGNIYGGINAVRNYNHYEAWRYVNRVAETRE